ncbi:MAG TPA: cytidylate kinase-like family protein [Anaerolineaceae bacterium]|nr:cytidylate kinase-like family protein [Anaerolineaceae bacterium]
MAVITISRQYGSGGDEIAERVSQILGYRYFDRCDIVRAAGEAGLSEEEISSYSRYSEESFKFKKFVDYLLRRAHNISPAEVAVAPHPEERFFNETSALSLSEKAILAAYQAGNYVIVGRGGQVILKDRANVLHLRIEAPLELRVHHVHHLLRKEREAYYPDSQVRRSPNDLIHEKDTASADYVRRNFGCDWSDPVLYHAVLNTGKLSIEQAADLIVRMVNLLYPET